MYFNNGFIENFPLQSIPLGHNVAYDETKPSNEQQPVPVVYETVSLFPQQHSNILIINNMKK